jgi:hypothetical protein
VAINLAERNGNYEQWAKRERSRLDWQSIARVWAPGDGDDPAELARALDPERMGDPVAAIVARMLTGGRDRVDILAVVPDIGTRLAAVDPDGDNTPRATLTTWTAAEILTTDWPEPVWAVPGILPVGLCMLAGKPKAGKSWLALQIAQAVATGGMALGRRVERGPVLYLALEDTPRRLQDRMRHQGWPATAAGEAEFMTLARFETELGNLATPDGIRRLAGQMHAKRYRLVVIDTLSRAIRGDQNDADRMTAALSPLQGAALDLNCVVMMIDHHRKFSMADTDPILDLGGSVAKGGTADCLWGLYREQGKAGAILHILGRDVDEIRLKLGHDPVTRCWQCEGDADRLTTDAEQETLEAVLSLGRCQLGDVVTALGREDAEKGKVHTFLQGLVEKGHLVRSKEGRHVFYDVG